jgi:hypothetical protein
MIPCKASPNGTATVGNKIQGNVAKVEVLKSGLIMAPRVSALTRLIKMDRVGFEPTTSAQQLSRLLLTYLNGQQLWKEIQY